MRGDLSDVNGCLCCSARGKAAGRCEGDDEDCPASPYAEGNLAMSVTHLRCPVGVGHSDGRMSGISFPSC